MILNGLVRCEVCKKVTQVKIEVSKCSVRYPVYVPCKNCNTLFYGEYIQDNEKVECGINFINAQDVSGVPILPDYQGIITGDFISDKIKDITNPSHQITFPKWMAFKDRIGMKNYNDLFYNVNYLSNIKDQGIFEWARVLNLWFNKNYVYLAEQLEYFLDANKNNIPLNNEKQYLSALRRLTSKVTIGFFFNNEHERFFQQTKKNLSCMYIKYPDKTKRFIKELGKEDLFICLEKHIYERIKDFAAYIPDMIPIFSLLFLSEEERQLLLDTNSEYGTFTTSFERMKQLYIDCFETAVKTLVIPIGLENILKRGDYNNFNDRKVNGLDKFLKLDKAFDKIQLLNNANCFAPRLKENLNNKLRNSIGHCDYSVDNFKQSICYDKGRKQMSLCNVTYLCYNIGLYLMEVFDVITLLHEAYYEFHLFES